MKSGHFLPDSTYTTKQTTPEPVSYAWLRGFYPEISDEYEADEASTLATAANNVNKVLECYVAGISPVDETVWVEASITMDENGKPHVEWNPPLSTGSSR